MAEEISAEIILSEIEAQIIQNEIAVEVQVGGVAIATWGAIQGVLGDQSDLQDALDLKLDYGLNKAGFNLALSDGDFLFVGDITQYTDEMAQDAIGNLVGNGLDYNDATGAISVDESELLHNSLGTLQGGTAGQYYHLTAAQYTVVGNTSGVNTGDQNLSAYPTGSGSAGRVAFWSAGSVLSSDADFLFDGTTLSLGIPTTAVTNTDFIIGVSSNTRTGLIIQTKAGTTLPAFEIQDSAGIAKAKFDTTGNSALRINYSGTMAVSSFPGMVISLQNINDPGYEGSWLEILNYGGANKGCFFGMYNDNFEQYNWQGGPIMFHTYPTASNGLLRLRITNTGLVGIGAVTETAFLHLPASTTSYASLRITSGVAPTSPNAGDVWYNGTSLFLRSTTNQAVATDTNTLTFTNKRFTDRVGTTASSATPTPNANTDDMYTVTALAVNATFGSPTGTPTNGQSLTIRVKDNGTARTLAFNAIYRAIGVTLPTTTVISKTLYLGLKYNSADTKWDVLAVGIEA